MGSICPEEGGAVVGIAAQAAGNAENANGFAHDVFSLDSSKLDCVR